MNLDAVVSILIGIFRVHTFCQRSEGVGKFGILLLFLAFFRSQFAFASNVVQRFVDVNVAGSLVQLGASCIQLSFHNSQHVIYSREFDDGLAELLAVFGIGQTFVVGSL